MALSYALGGENHDATAIFYGRLLGDPEAMKKIDHPVYGTFVENDRGIPVESVNSFRQFLPPKRPMALRWTNLTRFYSFHTLVRTESTSFAFEMVI